MMTVQSARAGPVREEVFISPSRENPKSLRVAWMCMSYVRGDSEVDVRMGGSTARSQDGGNSQTRTACPTESSRRMLELLLFQSGGPPQA